MGIADTLEKTNLIVLPSAPSPQQNVDQAGIYLYDPDGNPIDLVGGKNFINVKSQGAKGDGLTNDAAAINRALARLTTGGRLYFPPGTYIVGSALNVVKYSKIVIEGAGIETTTIVVGASMWMQFGTTSQVAANAVAGATTVYLLAANGYVLPSQMAAGDTVRLILDNGAYHTTTLVSLTVGSPNYTAVLNDAIPAGRTAEQYSPVGTTVTGITIRNLTMQSTGVNGDAYGNKRALVFASSSQTRIENSRFYGFDAEAVSWPNCWGGRKTEQFDATVINCTFEQCGHDAVNPWQMDGFLCESNHFYQCLTGVESLARNAIIQGNQFRECGGIGAFAGLGYGVFVGSANRYQVRDVVVANNSFKDMDGRAVLISRETLYVNVEGNVAENVDTVAIEIRNNDITGETMVPQYINIVNNQIINATTAAVFLEDNDATYTTGPHHVQIHGNIFIRGANGGVGILIDPSCTDVSYWGNSFVGYTIAQQVTNNSALVPPLDVPALSLGPNILRYGFTKTSIADNVATGVFTITTTNETGDNDAGGYACRVHVLAQDGTYTAADSASMETEVAFARAMVAAGTGVNSAVAVIGSTASAATNAANRNIASLTVTVTETSEYVQTVNVTIDHSGALAAALSAVVVVELLWYGFQTAPTLAAA